MADDTVKKLFKEWKNLAGHQTGKIHFFPDVHPGEIFIVYYQRIFSNFSSDSFRKIGFIKKQKRLIETLSSVPFGKQEPEKNLTFWNAFQAYCSTQQSREMSPVWKQYITLSTLMISCWDAQRHQEIFQDFFSAALRESFLLLPRTITEEQLRKHESCYGISHDFSLNCLHALQITIKRSDGESKAQKVQTEKPSQHVEYTWNLDSPKMTYSSGNQSKAQTAKKPADTQTEKSAPKNAWIQTPLGISLILGMFSVVIYFTVKVWMALPAFFAIFLTIVIFIVYGICFNFCDFVYTKIIRHINHEDA